MRPWIVGWSYGGESFEFRSRRLFSNSGKSREASSGSEGNEGNEGVEMREAVSPIAPTPVGVAEAIAESPVAMS